MTAKTGPLFVEALQTIAVLQDLLRSAPAGLAQAIRDVLDELDDEEQLALLNRAMAVVVNGAASEAARITALRLVRNVLVENI